ncbi:MAG TPA: hypothetical protein VK699_13950 [Terriglobales bacterium]|jgi:hypothetical protein|nr:hypothetical protein [Terriglobales bacterium]
MRSSNVLLFLRRRRSGAALLFVFAGALAFFLASATVGSAHEPLHSPGWVVIPVDEYRTLHAEAFPAERQPEPPPVEATLTRVDYDLKVSGDLASGGASLTIDVLKEGWVRVPIPSGLLVREARLDGKLVSLVSNPDGKDGKDGNQLSAVLSHSGRAVLLLDIALPVASTAGEESLALPATASGVTRVSVELPRQGLDIKLTGGLLSEKTESATESKWVAYAHASEPLTFTWRKKTEDHRATQPLRMRGSLIQLVGLGEDSTSIYAEAEVNVTQGAASEVKIQVPEKVTINQVSGAMVADWEVKAGELAVTFLEPVEQTARFTISGETRTAHDGQIEIPVLRLPNTERETGGVAVEVLGAGEIKESTPQGMEGADASDLGEMVASRQSPSLEAFRFRTGDGNSPRSLTLNVARYEQQAVLMANVDEARYLVLSSSDGKVLTLARYAVRNNQRNFLKIKLPAGAMVWSATLSGKPVRPGQAPDGSLLLPLEKAHGGEEAPEFAVEVLYLSRGAIWNDKGKAAIGLPALDLPVSRTGVVVHYPPLFKVTTEPGGVFQQQAFENPVSTALLDGGAGQGTARGYPASAPPPPAGVAGEATQALFDKFFKESHYGKKAGIVPVQLTFPSFGPSVFLVSQLTSEGQAPALSLSYEKNKKGGAR